MEREKKNMYKVLFLKLNRRWLPLVPRCALQDNMNCISQKYDIWVWVRFVWLSTQCTVYCRDLVNIVMNFHVKGRSFLNEWLLASLEGRILQVQLQLKETHSVASVV